ncbi:major facilitator superfamily domain-containing protein [Suillus spraguei]|nr:major facilitator superfamily domain-containing protein [Suillus spraguei]
MSSLLPLSTNIHEPQRLSLARKLILLVMFCLTQFIDTLSMSALLSAIPALEASMGMTEIQSTWVFSGFRLTFSSFLLISGRLSDVYNPKTVFIGGVSTLGILSLCAGFVYTTVPILVLRAITGIASAMTIPSALKLLVKVFPDPLEQARAVGFFAGCGAVANMGGLVVGAMFVQRVSYHWVFWFVAFAADLYFHDTVTIGETAGSRKPKGAKWKSLDLVGVGFPSSLLIFAVTSGSTDGLPPRTWFYNNFSVLLATALLPSFCIMWQTVFHWSVMSTAVHMLPLGIVAFAASCTGSLSRIYSPKWIILTGLSLCMVATLLLALGGGKPENYWPFVFPAFVLGSAGVMVAFSHTNIAIFQAAPSSMSSTVGAMFNGALQFGSAIGLAAITSIETSVEATHGGSHEYAGRAASFWCHLGQSATEIKTGRLVLERYPQPTDESREFQQRLMLLCDTWNLFQGARSAAEAWRQRDKAERVGKRKREQADSGPIPTRTTRSKTRTH